MELSGLGMLLDNVLCLIYRYLSCIYSDQQRLFLYYEYSTCQHSER